MGWDGMHHGTVTFPATFLSAIFAMTYCSAFSKLSSWYCTNERASQVKLQIASTQHTLNSYHKNLHFDRLVPILRCHIQFDCVSRSLRFSLFLNAIRRRQGCNRGRPHLQRNSTNTVCKPMLRIQVSLGSWISCTIAYGKSTRGGRGGEGGRGNTSISRTGSIDFFCTRLA